MNVNLPHSELLILTAVPAAVAIGVLVLVWLTTRLRTVSARRRRLESADRIELATTASAAVNAAAESVKKMIEVLPGTSAALTGRSAVTAIEASTQAILAILTDIPARMQRVEEDVRKLGVDQSDMRELFNRLGR